MKDFTPKVTCQNRLTTILNFTKRSDEETSRLSLYALAKPLANQGRKVRHKSHEYGMNTKAAFTLAEILITLAIIGVVAALTIPNLMHAYKKHLIETRLQQTVVTLTDLFKRVEEGEGADLYTLYQNASSSSSSTKEKSIAFHKIFLKYIKAMPCSSTGTIKVLQCKSNTTYTHNPNITKWTGFDIWSNETLVLDNGVAFSLRRISSNGSGAIDVDLNVTSNKMVYGVDFFSLYLGANGRIYGAKKATERNNGGFTCDASMRGSDSKVITSVRDRCENPALDDWQGYTSSYCTALIECNNWKVPNDYPIKF
jgi:prepilin-type N-terminal cleavage/methylation domain-containing protein